MTAKNLGELIAVKFSFKDYFNQTRGVVKLILGLSVSRLNK